MAKDKDFGHDIGSSVFGRQCRLQGMPAPIVTSPLPEVPFPDDGRSFLASLSFADLSVLRTTSNNSRQAVFQEIWRRCQDYTYLPGHFDARCPRRTRSGRILGAPDAVKGVADRLVRFLLLHAKIFQVVDLRNAPIMACESDNLGPALRSMPRLQHIVLPFEGWSSPALRRNFQDLPVAWYSCVTKQLVLLSRR